MRILVLLMLTWLPVFAGSGEKIVTAARKQIGITVTYDPSYVSLEYPNGDVPKDRGVCTDVLVRAMRDGLSVDLQKQVHEDMRRHFSSYPKIWGLKRPDRNIDHRRVPNLQAFLKRRGCKQVLPKTGNYSGFHAGDIVTCIVPPNLPHIMIVSDRKSPSGEPMVIHNIGGGTQEELVLGKFRLTGHYRWKSAVK